MALFPLLFLSALIGTSVGYALDLNVFTNCDYIVHLLVMLLFLFNMGALALFVGSFVTRPRWVNVASFLVFAIAVITQTLLAVTGAQDIIYSPALPVVVPMIVFPMPWYHYGRVFQDILEVTQPSVRSVCFWSTWFCAVIRRRRLDRWCIP